ncbi:hypothetical protein FHG87_000469 [Trinorchestia longiramus]|nr:hypothetical protein FHG87_000469 [Trinorchestia longiramus]
MASGLRKPELHLLFTSTFWQLAQPTNEDAQELKGHSQHHYYRGNELCPTQFSLVTLLANGTKRRVNYMVIQLQETGWRKIHLKPIIPPDLRAKRTVFVRQLDRSIGQLEPDFISKEIAKHQPWAETPEISKIKHYTHVIKITFTDIATTEKVLRNGWLMFNTKMTPTQIEAEKYTHILICICCHCYKFEDHTTHQCTSLTPRCSE